MAWKRLAVLALVSAMLGSQDLGKLPDWARAAAEAAQREAAPDADAWVLLDRTEVAYAGEGEVRTHRFRLVKVLGERGLGAGTFLLGGLGGKASKVKKLKGWNLRPDGDLEKLDKDYTFSVASAGEEDFSTNTVSGGVLLRVVKGSFVAFESLQVIHHPVGPVEEAYLMESWPVRQWELEVGKKEGWFTNLKQVEVHLDAHHFQPWIQAPEMAAGTRIAASNIPPLPKDEGATPATRNVFPWVSVRFLDPELKGPSGWGNWDAHAGWIESQFHDRALPTNALPKVREGRQGLEDVTAWMRRELSYKQVYLTPDRGWTPERSAEVVRRHYGDCKDLACLLVGEAKGLGFKAYPVLSLIGGYGVVEGDEPPSLAFNHVIAAIRLDGSWGLPAEVDTPSGRFLLVDPTDRFTPLGLLGAHHRGDRVMICAEGKGIWVSIPDSALLKPQARMELTGTCGESGKVEANLTITETGDAWDLRSRALLLGQEKLKEILALEVVGLPPTGSLQVLSSSDPLDLSRPFELKLRVIHPEGFHLQGSECQVPNWGMKLVPPVAQKPGQARTLPVERRGFIRVQYHADLKIPRRVQPLLPVQQLETACRTLHWEARSTVDGSSSHVIMDMDEEDRDAVFPYSDRAKGVAELKKDRNAARAFIDDAFSFKVQP